MSEQRRAEFSPNRVYRYRLDIVWDEALPLCQFVGLNPSTADEVKDDNTIRRCKDFARRWGYGGLVMTNLFAFRSPYPKILLREPWPIGEVMPADLNPHGLNWNDYHLLNAHNQSALTVAAWGKDGDFMSRYYHVAKMLAGMKCFGRTQNNQPKHPLYMRGDAPLEDYGLT